MGRSRRLLHRREISSTQKTQQKHGSRLLPQPYLPYQSLTRLGEIICWTRLKWKSDNWTRRGGEKPGMNRFLHWERNKQNSNNDSKKQTKIIIIIIIHRSSAHLPTRYRKCSGVTLANSKYVRHPLACARR